MPGPSSTSDRGRAPVAEKSNSDEAILASLGYKQELKREFSRLQLFGLAFSIIGVTPSVASTVVFAIPNGGPIGMVWGWAVCSFFLMFIAIAIAELASAAPTSGGLYYWTFQFSSPGWRNILSWIVGYSNTISNIAMVASVDWGCAVQVMAAASIGSDLKFAPTTSQTFGVYCALVLCHATICSITTRFIARLQMLYISLNILLCFVLIIGVPAATPAQYRNSAKFALGDFENLLGWPNGYAFILSFLAPLWSVGAFDSSVHISEEATNASVTVPWVIVWATAMGCVLGWGINVALAFCMGANLESILESPIAQPMATILFQSFGQRWTLVVWSLIVIVQFMMGTSLLTACSRQTFAFSRDGALPFSGWLYHIHPRSRTPMHCVWFTASLAILLGLLAFAGPSAISAVFSLVVACQYVVYSIPISARFLGGKTFKPGPFSLGKFGLPVAIIAVVWMAFATIVFLFPTSPNPSAPDMNYTIVVLGGTITLSVMYYYFPKHGGRYWFNGPVANVIPLRGERGAVYDVGKGGKTDNDAIEETWEKSISQL